MAKAKLFHWLAMWDAKSSSWKPLGFRYRFEDTAKLVPRAPFLAGDAVHLGTVVCKTASLREAEIALGKLPPPPAVNGVSPVRAWH